MSHDHAAVVLNMDANGLGVARGLGRLGVDVSGVDTSPDALGLRSRYCRRWFLMPDPVSQPEAAVNGLLALAERYEAKPVLIPTADFYVRLLSDNAERLAERFLFNVPDRDVVHQIVDKHRQYAAAERAQIAVPRSYPANSPGEIETVRSQLRFPVFVKGADSHRWSVAFACKGFRANDLDELRAHLALARSRGLDTVVQEIIPGPNRNHYKVCAYFSRDRELLALFSTAKRRQYPVDFGVGTCMVSERRDDLIDLALRFFRSLNYCGVGSIEFKIDERDGSYRMLELNPRLWLQNIQATMAGVNFPEIYYRDVIGEHPRPVLSFDEGAIWINLKKDLLSFAINRRQNETGIGEWLRSVLFADSYAWFAWDDPRPGVATGGWKKLLALPASVPRVLRRSLKQASTSA